MPFKVPNEHRIRAHPLLGSDDSYGNYGAFSFPSNQDPHSTIFCIAAEGDGDERDWEHVSVSIQRGSSKSRLPNWNEMCQVKDIFWDDEDCVVQFHPPKSEYVNTHPFVLHLWKPRGHSIPTPPRILVG